jgi:histone H3/H4
MSTRRTKDSSAFHQNRFASSAEFERGLLANLVAKRCALIESLERRELIWFAQFLSHQERGLRALVIDLIEKFPHEIQTKAMAEGGVKRGKICSAAEFSKILSGSPSEMLSDLYMTRAEAEQVLADISGSPSRGRVQSPTKRNTDELFDYCLSRARRCLERDISEICLNPQSDIESGPWYFPNLFKALRQHLNDYRKSKEPKFTTAIGLKVSEVLDYTAFSGGLTLIQGEARTGKTFGARVWCEQRPGEARFAEVPPGNDEAGFFRALARALGLGNFLSYKGCQIRDRVESVLLTKNLLLVLDESQRLWPQYNSNRFSFPNRVTWIMTMANAGVPIAMISTPQFIEIQKAVEITGWNSHQLTGRIKHYEPLPTELSQDDLIGVARAVLPEASSDALKALAIYARNSARYLAAIDSIADRARYLAMKAGRDTATTADVQKAMKESVIPADSKLQSALASGLASKRGRLSPGADSIIAGSNPSDRIRNEFPAPPERLTTPGQRALETPLIKA